MLHIYDILLHYLCNLFMECQNIEKDLLLKIGFHSVLCCVLLWQIHQIPYFVF